jgi:Family of unknown function (DUF5343)
MERTPIIEPIKNVPVYLSFKTFQSAIDTLRAHGLPKKIDRTAWDSRSGADQTQILSAFKFLGLIDDNENTQESLQRLKDAAEDSDEEKKVLSELLRTRYAKVFALDLKTATPGQLAEAIGSYGATGTTRERAVRFFIKAARYCGIPMSPRFVREASASTASTTASNVPPKVPNGHRTRRRKRATGGLETPPPPVLPGEHGTAMRTIALPVAGGTLTISGTFNPFSLVGEERTLVYLIIDKMNEYQQKSRSDDPADSKVSGGTHAKD